MFIKSLAAVCVLVTFATMASAQGRPRPVDPEIEALKARVAQLESRANESWLDEQRAEQIKALVREVIADADTRASLAEGGVTAGYNDGFFIASQDGDFLLRIGGRVQFRYVAAFADDASSVDEGVLVPDDTSETGFSMRRTRLKFYGHVFSPDITYYIEPEFDRGGGDLLLKQSWMAYNFDRHHSITVGEFKSNFLREEQISDGSQQTVERTNVNEFFTLDYSEGVEFAGEYDRWRWWAAIHDGRENENTDFDDDATDFAVNGRAEMMLAGESWRQWKDFAAWSGDPFGVLVGAGIDYENGEGGEGSAFNWEHMLQYTADVSVDLHPLNLYAAYVGRMVEHDPGAISAGDDDYFQQGVILQAGVFLIPDKWDLFVRWEYLDFDGAAELEGVESSSGRVRALGPLGPGVEDEQQIYALGTNWYEHKHDLKFTFDILWAPDGIRQGESGGGTLTSNLGEDDQFVLRSQVQLQF